MPSTLALLLLPVLFATTTRLPMPVQAAADDTKVPPLSAPTPKPLPPIDPSAPPSTTPAQPASPYAPPTTAPSQPAKPSAPPTPAASPAPPSIEPIAPPTKPYPPQTKAPPPAYVPPPKALPTPPVKKEECVPLCEQRCALHSRKRLCVRACSTCCARCKCVPPGTYGNRELCGKCYTDMTTHGNRIKCP